ncbi:hypothetical protein [Legionella jordanis]|uniref:hypothetical protein n=1 Tax=Legionella jordanis TaxID=456 RepID=UPI000EFBD600|nr:hypothetical protein [Legionella jordanis]RMX02482.1 hypothetical protein EAW55_09560 [Legionella jordanis]
MSGSNPVNQTSTLLALGDTLYAALPTGSLDIPAHDYKTFFYQRNEIASLLSYYSAQLNSSNPFMFKYLNEAQKIQQQKQLLFTLYLYSAQAKIDEVEGRTRNLKDHMEGMNKCLQRLRELQPHLNDNREEAQLQQEISTSNGYLAYLGLTMVAPWLVSEIMEFIDPSAKGENAKAASNDRIYEIRAKDGELDGFAEGKKTKVAIEGMSQVNARRLYWVWGGGMLASILELMAFNETLPLDQIGQAQKHLSTPSSMTGTMSWALYYTRFGIQALLLMKHSGPWVNQTESQIPAWDRFKTQWQQRKFAILNDSIWATANLVCFFWLRGVGAMGYAGNVLTALLLLMDLTLTIWRFVEESTKHNVEMQAFETRKEKLLTDISKLDGEIEANKKIYDKLENNEQQQQLKLELEQEIKEAEKKKAILQAELLQFSKVMKQSQTAWKYKKYGLINDTVYAAGLLFAFCIVCSFFFPPPAIAPLAALIMAVGGAALCFSLTIAAAAVGGGLEIAKTKESIREAREDCRSLLQEFKDCADENVRKQLYLEMKALMAQTSYQEALVKHQAIKLLRSVFVDAVIPALVFASLVFMPLGIGLAAMAVGLAVALISHLIISHFEPKKDDYEELKDVKQQVKFESEYNEFVQRLETSDSTLTDKDLTHLFATNENRASRTCGIPSLFGGHGYTKLEPSSNGPDAAIKKQQ